MSGKSRNRVIVVLVAIVAVVGVIGVAMLERDGLAVTPRSRGLKLEQIPFNGTRAYDYLRSICDLGQRYSGSPGMEKQRQLIVDHFTALGAKVELQPFEARHPLTGDEVKMANIIVRFHPDSKDRILLAAHYDTRPFPDRDYRDPRGVFIGANDGASGVEVLMELGNNLPKLKLAYGVDMVFFDGEELVYEDPRDPYFLGSEFFARDYVKSKPPFRYRCGVLLDMVGDADLQLFYETQSYHWPETRPLMEQIWGVAKRLGVKEFISIPRYTVNDDHVKLRNDAGIPTCVIIDFSYPAWHTSADVPEQCSALSLAKVGWVVEEWLKSLR